MLRTLLVASVLAFGIGTAESDIVALEYNANLSPANTAFPSNLNEVGWFFTPTTTFDVSGVNTRFSSTDGRTVTASIFATALGLPVTAAPLASGTFTAGTSLAGTMFAPVTLLAGVQYFAAFANVANLGVNFTNAPGAVAVSPARFTLTGDSVRFSNELNTSPENQPILQFLTPAPAAVPEPSTSALLALCALFGGGAAWRRRRAAAA